MENYQNDEIEIDLKSLFFAWLEKIWMVVLCTVMGAIIAGVVTLTLITPQYSSTSMIYIINQGTDLSSISLSDLQIGSALTSDYTVLITSRPVVNKVISNLKLDMTYQEFVNTISITNPTDTRLLQITVTNPDPYMAKTIVDELTNVAIKRTAEIMEMSEPNMAEEGTVNTSPISPSKTKNILLGGLLGGFLATAIIVVLYLMNDSIKTSEDIERYLGLDTLAVIPLEEGAVKNPKKRKKQMKKSKKKGAA